MGQKVNPNIFRLGINKAWKIEFFEKKQHELPLYTFKDLEIKNYIERFLESQGLFLHDYRQHYSSSTLNLYVSYVVSSDLTIVKKDKLTRIILSTREGERKKVQRLQKYLPPKVRGLNASFKHQQPLDLYKIKTYLQLQSNNRDFLNKRESSMIHSKNQTLNLKIEGVLNGLFKVLTSFTNNKFNLVVTFCCVNKTSSFLKRTQKKNFILLQKFKRTPFLKEGIELLFHVIHTRSSADLLAKFIGTQVRKIKRHKFFLSFLKQTLTVLSNSKFSVVRGIKITIKGRLNGVPRARHKTISIGNIPVQTISALIDYSQMTVHNSSGSYGVKVWIIEA